MVIIYIRGLMSEVNAVCTKSTIVVWHMVSAQEIVALVCMLRIRSIFLSDKILFIEDHISLHLLPEVRLGRG